MILGNRFQIFRKIRQFLGIEWPALCVVVAVVGVSFFVVIAIVIIVDVSLACVYIFILLHFRFSFLFSSLVKFYNLFIHWMRNITCLSLLLFRPFELVLNWFSYIIFFFFLFLLIFFSDLQAYRNSRLLNT